MDFLSRILSRLGFGPRRVVALAPADDSSVVSVVCPYCGDVHRHAWNPYKDGLDGPGVMAVRPADCGSGQYIIEVPRGR